MLVPVSRQADIHISVRDGQAKLLHSLISTETAIYVETSYTTSSLIKCLM